MAGIKDIINYLKKKTEMEVGGVPVELGFNVYDPKDIDKEMSITDLFKSRDGKDIARSGADDLGENIEDLKKMKASKMDLESVKKSLKKLKVRK